MTSPSQYHNQINCGDVKMLSQKRPSLVLMARWVIDNYFSGFVCSGHKIVRNKIIYVIAWIIISCSLVRRYDNDFHLWLHSWKSLPNHMTCDKEIFIHSNPYIILYIVRNSNIICAAECTNLWMCSTHKSKRWISIHQPWCGNGNYCITQYQHWTSRFAGCKQC